MNLGQMLLVAGAVAMLATLTVSINSTILQAYVISYDSEATIDATSIGQAMIDEILTQKFDSLTVGTQIVKSPSLCTPPSRLGPDLTVEKDSVHALEIEPFRSMEFYNDIDDYNHYSRIVNTPHLGKFTVKDTVYYVPETNLDDTTKTTPQTWYKKIVVTITHPNLYRPVVMKSLVVFRRILPTP
ncbi:MAG: hypothetical protein HY033_12445 [Ignavibacteriae bacterium]|nr:hypothetical protein [Ignavibacteria bacterium]MBI3365702.1 hypothetical protein [Ignavibacteriota bacterium]